MKKNTRIKIIQDRLFKKIWYTAIENNDEQMYINMVLRSDRPLIDHIKLNITYEEIVYMLSNIYKMAHISFKDLLEKSNLKKCEVSNYYCIPIRTVEDWYNGKNKCPEYVKLMILRSNHMLILGKYIKLQSELLFEKKKPGIYKKKNISDNADKAINSKYTDIIDPLDDVTNEESYDSLKTAILLDSTSYLKRNN